MALIVLAGCAVLLIASWRIWGPPLAIAGFAALLLFAVWNAIVALPEATPISAILAVGIALHQSLEGGILGSMLYVMLAFILPIYVSGNVLTRLLCPGLPIDMATAGRSFEAGHGLLTRQQVIACLALPALIIGGLIVAERAGLDLAGIAIAGLVMLFALSLWFWLTAGRRNARPAASLRDAVRSAALDFGRLMILIMAAGVILAVLDRTALPIDIARFSVAAAGEARMPMLLFATLGVIGLSLAMPALAAYLLAAALLGPALRTVGFDDIAIHATVLLACATVAAGVGTVFQRRAAKVPLTA